ncbi:hypothetical protein [Cytophaga aurantiaca]|uniref:hypothetical protein n=1 Tax=Cytophaga aurantiaca TaxID=29530 RepID=UPI000377DAFC|nr:hypothetical protein [Cytophaga aurantiaca]
MKTFFFFSILVSTFIFTSCKKTTTEPGLNQLVVVDQSGTTTTYDPIVTEIYGPFDPSFTIALKQPTTGYGFSIYFKNGLEASPVVFHSDGNPNGTTMWIGHPVTGIWVATGGTAEIVAKNNTPISTSEPKSIRITFNNVEFTRPVSLFPAPSPDTIWVSSVINAFHR